MLLDGRPHCNTVDQGEAESRRKWTNIPLRVIQITRRYGLGSRKSNAIKLLRLTNTLASILNMDCSFLSVTNALLTYPCVSDRQYNVSFTVARDKNIVDGMLRP